ncbi:MAG: rhomboid family intramembrane serine protease [Gemmatimonadota bacterium]|jgi:membrane associated rhomboid family serine protease|nr:rhomboid family intramembrane serine protease [Gemmatimonadota bacterium]MDP6462142.1 rhomboid family intramembrane serine protease [Gemmatimonadota bacterium]MDP6528509.1 rhomboid family intramembrane serine protease [Gemmatimonadota bacterium]MDP6803076.1 rhomboid family intramembrane serine protease [Gemmatimonadota bacterium]
MFLPLKDVNPATRRPWVTLALMAANTLAYLAQVQAESRGYSLVAVGGFVPVDPAPVALLTSMFLHGGVLHLGGNLLYLWIFGNNVEDVLGHGRFLVFYLLAGLGGHLAHGLVYSGSAIPTIGASGAISGILAAYLIRFPRSRVVSILFLGFFFRLIRTPASVVIGWWIVIQLLRGVVGFGEGGSPGVAWFEHIGGFAAGLVLFKLLEAMRR